MNILESVILGGVQGITEFVPVSSSGHLEIVQQIMGDRAGDFHIFLQFVNIGTLLALLIFFHKRIIKIIVDICTRKNYRLALNILITSIPAGIIGFLLADFISTNGFFSSLYVIATAMLLIGIIMIIVDRLPHLSKLRNEDQLTHPRALTIGLAQVLALIPGVSRSGSTIITGRLMGLNSKSAAEYSFLASIPIFMGVVAKTFINSSDREYFASNIGSLLISNAVAFALGLLALFFVIKILSKPTGLRIFGYYRVIVATLVLITLLIQ
jgi:undecaprenyl-diphosphatase